ncbi:putative acetyltransferase [Sphingomonas changbaiensis NBRC 104936]|uniref:Putative acetyltransferase n=1 Tax=Sphingomonas changbaiensis NBRC 104936 TaxID=1219043 RepID=A0A0E9MNQ5_9SPHN|nr:GNAT family N-acetyltransferase [Sphingomonas changbaiensis]GAO38765.1 putative acetyltransferase [Sphingomonas changbaiensis NBRC 104936]
MIEIRTERLRLRPATAADLPSIHSILSDPRATAYWSTPPHQYLEQSRAWLRGMIDIPADEGEDFVVEQDGRVIGKAGLYRFPEIGFIFNPEMWGRGFAAEALRAVLDRAFNLHGLAFVEADVDPRNEAALKLLARLGFRESGRKERTWLVGEEWCDSVYLRLSRADWLKQNRI